MIFQKNVKKYFLRDKTLPLVLLLLVTLTGFSPGQTETPGALKIKFKKISDGIYPAYRPETLRYWVEGNVIIINGKCLNFGF